MGSAVLGFSWDWTGSGDIWFIGFLRYSGGLGPDCEDSFSSSSFNFLNSSSFNFSCFSRSSVSSWTTMASFRPFVFVLGFRLFVLSDSLFLSRDLLRDLSLLAVFSIPIRFAGLIKHSFLVPQIHISIASIIPSMLDYPIIFWDPLAFLALPTFHEISSWTSRKIECYYCFSMASTVQTVMIFREIRGTSGIVKFLFFFGICIGFSWAFSEKKKLIWKSKI